MSDYPLFDDPPAQRHSPTSVAAAEAIRAAMPALRRRVLDALGDSGERGLTDEEGIDGTGLSPSTYRPRRVELCERGLCRDSGRTRRVRSGKAAVVWVATTSEVQGG
jgi:hypothetical protein